MDEKCYSRKRLYPGSEVYRRKEQKDLTETSCDYAVMADLSTMSFSIAKRLAEMAVKHFRLGDLSIPKSNS